ncbi:MAG: spondin domain-containing protein [Planctomycetota bacterium]
MRLNGRSVSVLSCVACCLAAAGASSQTSTAMYELRFDSLWSPTTHAGAYVASAHFSPLIGGVHSNAVSFWEPGGIASEGMERMAEIGRVTNLRNEVNAAIAAGTALARVQGVRIDDFPDTTTLSFEATDAHDRLTLVTMIAPSPDWFVGTHGLALRDSAGEWLEEIVVGLDAYDAGTDSGTDLTSADSDTNPQEPIRNIQNEPPFNGLPVLGRYTLTLVSVDECDADVNADGALTPGDFNAWVLAFNSQADACDQNGDGQCTPGDFNAWVLNFNAGC